MRLIPFRYLRRHYVLILTSIILLISTLFSVTAFSLLSFYDSFNAYLEEEGDIITIYDKKSRTPFTGLVSLSLTERLSMIKGVLLCSPEVFVPCSLKGEQVFLRGVLPKEFSRMKSLEIVDGRILEPNDLNYVIVGRRLAGRLSLRVNDRVLVRGVLRECYLELKIKGVYDSHSSIDDEAVVPLHIGQWLRGAAPTHVTLVRVKIDRSLVSSSEVFAELSKGAQENSQGGGEKPEQKDEATSQQADSRIGEIGVEEALMRSYLDRHGVTRETLLMLSIMVFFFSSASVAAASSTLIQQHGREIDVLNSLGASRKTIKLDLLAKMLSISLVAAFFGTVLSFSTLWIATEKGYFQVLSHSIILKFNPFVVALNFTLVVILVTLSVAHSHLKR